jgi:hypothetical protein
MKPNLNTLLNFVVKCDEQPLKSLLAINKIDKDSNISLNETRLEHSTLPVINMQVFQ